MSRMIISIFMLIVGLAMALPAHSATYYMNADGSEDCANLHECFGMMSGGDTLIIRDGVYTGEENVIDHSYHPPNGSDGSYTTIRAENIGRHPIKIKAKNKLSKNVFSQVKRA